MDEVTIRPLRNGPYEVKGKLKVLDHGRNEYVVKEETFYLCRCGQSRNKPFCDSTHRTVGFKAEESVDNRPLKP